MKTLNNISKGLLGAGILLASLTGCSEDMMDKVNKDPNHTQNVQAKFILADVITSTAFSNVGGDFSIYGSAYIEQEVGVHNQLYRAEIRNGEPSASATFNNVWSNVYTALRNARIAVNKCSEGGEQEGNLVTKGIAEVLVAYNSAILADMFGDTPWSEAALINPDGTPTYMNPKVDKQEDIYAGVMKSLDDAIADLQGKDLHASGPMGDHDLLYQASAAKWLKLAYGLKARYTMHLINRSSSVNADMEKVLEYVSKSFTSAGEQAAFNIYSSNNINPLFGFFDARWARAGSQSMADKLIERNDPRMNRAFVTVGDSYEMITDLKKDKELLAPNGTPVESQDKYSVSMYMFAQTAPSILLSYHEVLFLKAEALCRLNRIDEAEATLKDAVVAGIANAEVAIQSAEKYMGEDLTNAAPAITTADAEAYFDNNVKALFTTNPLKETMIQKYIALWGANGEAVEAYNDVRRLKAMGEELITLKNKAKFPLRCPYGNSDTTTNPEVKAAYGDGQYVYTEPVWWAGGSR